jgi:hypothetical protein
MKKVIILLSAATFLILAITVWVAITASPIPQQTSLAPVVSFPVNAEEIKAQPADTTKDVSLAEIPQTESTQRSAFLQTAAEKYHVESSTPTPKLVTNACMIEETNKFQDFAQSTTGRKLSTEQRQEKLHQVKEYCYQTYSADGKVPPEPPERDPQHIH